MRCVAERKKISIHGVFDTLTTILSYWNVMLFIHKSRINLFCLPICIDFFVHITVTVKDF